jgi:hypothetical protein
MKFPISQEINSAPGPVKLADLNQRRKSRQVMDLRNSAFDLAMNREYNLKKSRSLDATAVCQLCLTFQGTHSKEKKR